MARLRDVPDAVDQLRRTARTKPDELALVDGARRLTWRDLDEQVDRTAAGLHSRVDAAPGARVALHLPTGAEFVTAYLGVLRAGLVAVPIDPSYTAAEVDQIVADSGAAVLLDQAGAAALAATAPGAEPVADARGGEEIVTVLYTSGTSGRGKGAMLSARALAANVRQVLEVRPNLVQGSDIVFLPVPLSHILGLNAGLGVALAVGATIVLDDSGASFDPAGTLETMAAEAVTVVLAVPGQYAAWAAQPGWGDGFGTVRFAMSGSTRLGAGLVQKYAQAGVALRDGYGLTETAPVVALSTPSDDAADVAGSVGRPLPGVEVELRDADGQEVDDGDPGRLFVRGDNLFSGYWPDGRGGPDADGWFGTGDIAVADAAGRLRLVGRSTDLVIVNGFNVYPAEVETALAAMEGVAEAAVVGVDDARTGEAVHAYVVPVAGAELRPATVIEHAATVLARFKVPSAVHVVAQLPHTVTGKVSKWRLTGGEHGAD